MSEGIIFDIQPFSVYDGPGIRTTVFLKGCNLRCAWCHNPESWKSEMQLRYYPSKCIGCGNCFNVCPNGAHVATEKEHIIDRKMCSSCGKCADNCYSGALAMAGERVTAEKLFEKINEDKEYFKNSGGGVTFSGGEAMLQFEFLKEILMLCNKAGIHTAVDTAGNVPFESFKQILPYTDLFLYDIKAASRDLHMELTCASNTQIIRNLDQLVKAGADVIVRVPCVPQGNFDDMENIAELLSSLNVPMAELLAYHKLGEGKSNALGLKARQFTVPTAAQMKDILEIFIKKGVNTIYKQ